ncbi:zinc ribbon domain-containing protein [Euzebya sp.]|uniref:zinc ribbon domain-containing protein n=1 Tax=Euzebya sp. TaxID=1971409 RepID=UPI00351634A2
MKATPEQQQQLLTLADTDEEIRRLEHKRQNLPEQKALDLHVETQEKVADELVEATQTQERLAAQTARHEREIETAEAGRKHSEAQIYSGQLKSERELQARREEISEFKRRKSDIEDSLLEIMEQSEEVGSLVEELTARRTELAEQVTDLTRQRDEAAADIDAELEALRTRRGEESGVLDEGVLGAYDTLKAKRPGRVVARLERRTCTGCQLELTAIELEEIKETARHSLAYCQQCGSIIVPA